MKLRILILLCSMSFALMASAQASGGQIRRTTTKPRTEVKKRSKPRKATTPQVEQQSTSTYSTPAIQPISLNRLCHYNVVVCSFSLLSDAQAECQKIRDEGFFSEIVLDVSNTYRVLMYRSSNSEEDARRCRNRARKKYPTAWIMYVNNGHVYKYDR